MSKPKGSTNNARRQTGDDQAAAGDFLVGQKLDLDLGGEYLPGLASGSTLSRQQMVQAYFLEWLHVYEDDNFVYVELPQARNPAPLPAPLFVSFDLGATWHPAAHGLAARGVTALLADPSGAVWAGTQDAGVFRSVDGGRHWSAAGKGTEGQAIGALAQAPHRTSLLLAGGGLAIEPAGSSEGPGIFRTISTGATWAVAGPGPDATFVFAIVADASIPGQITAADLFTGAYRSGSGGVSWRRFNAGLPGASAIAQIEGDTVVSGEIYAATGSEPPVLFQRGAAPPGSWRPMTGIPAPCIGPLTVGARGQLFLGAAGTIGGEDQGGVCASQDGGAHWTVGDVSFTSILSITVAPSNPSRVYASGVDFPSARPGQTFLRSDDGGVAWTGESAISTSAAHGLAVDPVDADLVYAAAAGGAERSRDGGVTWEMLLPGHATMVRVDPQVPSTIYAAPGTIGSFAVPPPPEPPVSVSDDGGATWSPLAEGLPPNVAVLDLAFDAGSSSLLYAATAGGGAFRMQRDR